VKLVDFGLAKTLEAPKLAPQESETTSATPRTEEGQILGTVVYMSPEQAQGKPVDARSDMFSFGTLLYEMLTGTGN
jgi:serine/threonine protein kinase